MLTAGTPSDLDWNRHSSCHCHSCQNKNIEHFGFVAHFCWKTEMLLVIGCCCNLLIVMLWMGLHWHVPYSNGRKHFSGPSKKSSNYTAKRSCTWYGWFCRSQARSGQTSATLSLFSAYSAGLVPSDDEKLLAHFISKNGQHQINAKIDWAMYWRLGDCCWKKRESEVNHYLPV
jgi:hypothetical protein